MTYRSSFLRAAVVAFATSLFACAAAPADPPADDAANADPPAAPAPPSKGEEHLGESQEELKWTTPVCSYYWWYCGACICNACGVEDCRGARAP